MEKLELLASPTKYIPTEVGDLLGFNYAHDFHTEKKTLLVSGNDNGFHIKDDINKYPEYYKIFMLAEEPTGYATQASHDAILFMESTFDLILSICKYSNEWRQKYYNSPRRIQSFIPIHEKNSFPSEDKEFDVYWTGSSKEGTLTSEIPALMKMFNNKIVSDSRISHINKMKFNGKSKISVTYGMAFVRGEMEFTKSLPNWKENPAFSQYDASGLVPQLKTRTFEAAFSKSIILNKRDPWNIIEDWFEPEKEFLYYDDKDDLKEKIHAILQHYGDYYHIAESAYNKAINNYTFRHYIEKYIIPNTKLEA